MAKKTSSDVLDELESNIKLLCDQANNHMKVRDYSRALIGYNKALDLNVNDINALIARSKCFLLLGEPSKALQDAENALIVDIHNIRAVYQKAESLYYLGQFEQSLIFFHRGLRARPELISFRLGVQKTQQAIENTIGLPPNNRKTNNKTSSKTKKIVQPIVLKQSKPSLSKSNTKAKEPNKNMMQHGKKLLGNLCVDQQYLQNLFKHPDLQSQNISELAKDAAEFLINRQEFWRQQRPCTALPNYKNTNPDNIPPWF